jgi:hypothetical protein
MPTTGVAMTWIQLVAYRPQQNSGMRKKPMPLARSRWMVVMKFMPVRIELNPSTKAAITASDTFWPLRSA